MAAENQVVIDSVFDWTILSVKNEDDFTEKRHSGRSQSRRHSNNRPLVATTGLTHTQRKKKRANSLHPRANVGYLPLQPAIELSENSSYNGSEELEESTLKTAKLPAIDRARLPSETSEPS
jgi:hypothetical protein